MSKTRVGTVACPECGCSDGLSLQKGPLSVRFQHDRDSGALVRIRLHCERYGCGAVFDLVVAYDAGRVTAVVEELPPSS